MILTTTGPTRVSNVGDVGLQPSAFLRHPTTIPRGRWIVTAKRYPDGTADLTLEQITTPKGDRMGEPLTAYHLANIIAGYLDDRDDIASALVNPSEDVDQALIEVTGQGGNRFVLPVVALREGGNAA